MFRLKICGVTTAENAKSVCDAGADAIGLNFYSKSPRFVSFSVAAQISAAIPEHVAKVGVFVNETACFIRDAVEHANLSYVQLHGDEHPEFVALLAPLPVIRAFRCRDATLQDVVDYLKECQSFGRLPHAILLDAYQPGMYGGAGVRIDWAAVAANKHRLPNLPMILAGGITPENVADAIRAVQPDAVDVASGVESEPGVKDVGRVIELVSAVIPTC